MLDYFDFHGLSQLSSFFFFGGGVEERAWVSWNKSNENRRSRSGWTNFQLLYHRGAFFVHIPTLPPCHFRSPIMPTVVRVNYDTFHEITFTHKILILASYELPSPVPAGLLAPKVLWASLRMEANIFAYSSSLLPSHQHPSTEC